MKNKIYNIIYLCGLLIDSQASISGELNETNNTIIPEENTIILEESALIPEENVILEENIPEEIINIDIDMNFVMNSKIGFIICYSMVSFIVFIVLIIKQDSN